MDARTFAAVPPPLAVDPFAPWHGAMARGATAARQGWLLLALASYQEALAIARALLRVQDGRSDDRVAALVVAHHQLAETQADAGAAELAATHLALAHETLMGLLCDPDAGGELQQAALRHSRETHAALLLHLQRHGPHPTITRALRAGCLGMTVHQIH